MCFAGHKWKGKERAACWRDKSVRVVSYPKWKDFGEEKGAVIPRDSQGLYSSAVCWEINPRLYDSDHKHHQLRMSEKVM